MGRDDAKAVPGLQGGRAPAQAFAAYMRFAVKDRPIEEFDTELNLPEWQLEPDDEYLYGDPDEYYFIDEQGNLIEPGRRDTFEDAFDIEGERSGGQSGPRVDDPPAAASEDFLERATGQEISPESQPPPRSGQRRSTPPGGPGNAVPPLPGEARSRPPDRPVPRGDERSRNDPPDQLMIE